MDLCPLNVLGPGRRSWVVLSRLVRNSLRPTLSRAQVGIDRPLLEKPMLVSLPVMLDQGMCRRP